MQSPRQAGSLKERLHFQSSCSDGQMAKIHRPSVRASRPYTSPAFAPPLRCLPTALRFSCCNQFHWQPSPEEPKSRKENTRDVIRDGNKQAPLTCPPGWFCMTLGNNCGTGATPEPLLTQLGAGWPRAGLCQDLSRVLGALQPRHTFRSQLWNTTTKKKGRRRHEEDSFPRLLPNAEAPAVQQPCPSPLAITPVTSGER